jgi:hypothetical protein
MTPLVAKGVTLKDKARDSSHLYPGALHNSYEKYAIACITHKEH